MPRFRRLTLSALVATALLAPLAATAHASLPRASGNKVVTFGLGPANSRGADGRAGFTFTAAPGAFVDDHVAVLNYSAQALPLSLYATDGYNTYSGAENLLEADKKPDDVGAWTQLHAPKLVTVPPRRPHNGPPGVVVVPFRLTVPRGAEPGDHVGGIVASLRTLGRNDQGLDVHLDQRVAAPILLRVTGALDPRLVVTDLRARYRDSWNPFGRGSVRVAYTVKNVGNVRLGGRQRVDAAGLFGSWGPGPVVDVPLLLPGGEAHLDATIPRVWPEVWMHAHARVTALATAADASRPVPRALASTAFWAVPWALLGLVLLLWLLRRALLVLARRRPSPKHAQGRAVLPADAVEDEVLGKEPAL